MLTHGEGERGREAVRERGRREVGGGRGEEGGEQKQRHDGLSRKIKIRTPSLLGGRGGEEGE